MRILSADRLGAPMPKISKNAIKRMVSEGFGVSLNDGAAEAITRIIERRATDIASHAVSTARSKKRNVVLREDVEDYSIKHGV